MIPEVIAGSSTTLTVSFMNESGAPEAPTSVSYSVWDIPSNTSIRENTTVTPGASVSIPLTSSDTAIRVPNSIREQRRVIVTSVSGDGNPLIGIYDFPVRNPLK